VRKPASRGFVVAFGAPLRGIAMTALRLSATASLKRNPMAGTPFSAYHSI
jgi:hypothetical protein